MTARQNAKRRGTDFEARLAHLLGGSVYPGQAGDVTAYGVRIEAKYRTNLTGYGELREHLDQAQRNSAASGLPWALALTGGREYRNAAIYIVLPLADWQRLQQRPAASPRLARLRELLAQLQQELGLDPGDPDPDPGADGPPGSGGGQRQ